MTVNLSHHTQLSKILQLRFQETRQFSIRRLDRDGNYCRSVALAIFSIPLALPSLPARWCGPLPLAH